MGRIIATTTTTVNMNDLNNGPVVITSEIHHEEQDEQQELANIADHLGASPYSNIAVGRIQTDQYASPMRVPNRHSLSVQRPKQKVRKPSKQWLDNKSGTQRHF